MNPLLTKIKAAPIGHKVLDLSNCDLYQMTIEELIQAFKAIPFWICSLDLSWNYPGILSASELKTIFLAIPKTVTFLNLTGQSFHKRAYTDLVKIFSPCSAACIIETGNLKLNQIIKQMALGDITMSLPQPYPFLASDSISLSAFNDCSCSDLPFSTTHIDEMLTELNIPAPFIYSLHSQRGLSERAETSRSSYLLKTTAKQLPVMNPPERYFQVNHYAQNEISTDIYYQLPEGSNTQNPPISLKDMMDEDAFIKPTLAQLVELITRVIRAVDYTADDYCCYPSMDTIYIINTQDIGTNKLLKFKLCPSSFVALTALPLHLQRHTVHRRMIAVIFLLLATQSTELGGEDFWPKVKQSLTLFPGFVSAFFELWESSSLTAPIDAHKTIERLSPTVTTFFKLRRIRTYTWDVDHTPGLLTGMACHHIPVISYTATDSLHQLLSSATGKKKQHIIGIIEQAIELLMPTPLNALEHSELAIQNHHWICRMNMIKSVLQQVEQTGDGERLHHLQYRLMKAGMGELLFDTLFKPKGKLPSKVLTSTIMVAIWMSFQFDTLRIKLMQHKNLLAWIKLLLSASKKLGEPNEYKQHVLMMFILTNFGSWHQHTPGIKELRLLWEECEPEQFIDCCHANYSLSNETAQLIIKKLEHIVMKLLNGSQPRSLRNQTVINKALDYLHHLAWRAPLQTATASIQSLEHANVLAVLTKQHNLSIFTQAQPSPTKIAGDSIQTIFNLLKQIDSADLSDYPVLRKTFKFPISYNDLLGYRTSGAGIVPTSNTLSRYLPDTVKSGAPANIKHCYLSLSKNSMITYSNTKNVIHSVSLCTLKKQRNKFMAENITSDHRICTVKPNEPGIINGTQGAYLVQILDAGISRDIQIGVTWDVYEDNDFVIPGTSPTSVALDVSTGVIKYRHAKTGQQVEYHYAPPCHSGSLVIVCISGNEVYFTVNHQIYPLIPNLILPEGEDIHPLIRIASPGVSIRTEVMGSIWSPQRNNKGYYIHELTNPVALLLYHYSNRTTKCPHSLANTALSFPGLNALSKSEQLMLLTEEQKMTLFMIVLAQKTCKSTDCLAAATLITLLKELVTKTASPLTAQSLAEAIKADEAGMIETSEPQSAHAIYSLLSGAPQSASSNNAPPHSPHKGGSYSP